LKHHAICFRNENVDNYENPWIERPNFVALGVSLQSKTEQSTAWQILPSQTNVRNVFYFHFLFFRSIFANDIFVIIEVIIFQTPERY